jgi:NTE family protein
MILDFNRKLPGPHQSVKGSGALQQVRVGYDFGESGGGGGNRPDEAGGGVTKRRTVLVLGGGGMKGLAHVGAWRALREAGIEVDEVVGTSIGALVGACIGGGLEHDRLQALARALQKSDIATLNRWALLLNGIRQPSVFRGDTFRSYLEGVLPAESFEELSLPVGMNAVDLATGRLEWFGAGGRMDVSLCDAVYASCALPVFYPPAEIGGSHYVDGGVLDALPARRAVERGADLVIAVDVGAGAEVDAADTVAKGMVAIHQRVMQISGYGRRRRLIEAWDGPELIYIRPDLETYPTFDFGSTEYFLAEGYRATRAALSGEAPARERAV